MDAGADFLSEMSVQVLERSGHGIVNVHRGIVELCDVFFYNIGL